MLTVKKIIPLLISFFLLINSFLFFNNIQNPYEFPKFIFAVIIVQIIALFLFIGKYDIKFDLLTKLIIAYLLLVFIADIIGLDTRTSLLGSEWRHQGFLILLTGTIFYLASRFAGNKEYIDGSILISGVFLSFIAITEFIMIQLGANYPTYNGRLVATMGNPNFLGAYLVMTLPFILMLKTKNKYFKPILTILISISILITASRSALIALFIVILIYLISKVKINNYLKLLIILVSFISFLIIFSQTSVFHRSSIWDSRTIIWNIGIEKMQEKPILGFGQENFELILPENLFFNIDNAHNLFLETIISSGVIGVIFLISIIIVGFKKANFKYKLFLVAFLITSFFNPLFVSGIILFWILIGVANKNDSETQADQILLK